jgi:transcriptional regulator with XRE-family HTH domain
MLPAQVRAFARKVPAVSEGGSNSGSKSGSAAPPAPASSSAPGPGSARGEAGADLAKRVAAARLRSGLTQAQLAEASGVTDETISRIERGRYEPAVSTLFRLAEALDISLDRLAGEPVRDGGGAPRRPASPVLSPVVRRLRARIDRLTPDAQRALLAIAERLPEATRATRPSSSR